MNKIIKYDMRKYIAATLITGLFMFIIYTPSKTPEPLEEYVEAVNPLECKKELLEREYTALKKELREYEQ